MFFVDNEFLLEPFAVFNLIQCNSFEVMVAKKLPDKFPEVFTYVWVKTRLVLISFMQGLPVTFLIISKDKGV